MGRARKKDYTDMFMYYFQGTRKNTEARLSIIDPQTQELRHFPIPQYKKTSYRDVARRFGYSLRQIEKIGSRNHWYLKRKYFHLKVTNQLPWNLEYIYK
jgi:hypothetical protein